MSERSPVTGYPHEPPGLLVLQVGGHRYLAFDPEYVDPPGSPWSNAVRTMGWYYGYPSCCVEGLIERDERFRAAFSEWLERQPRGEPLDEDRPDDPAPVRRPRRAHPISGHVLCPQCEAGPMAPLPARPAGSYGFLLAGVDGEPAPREPSGYQPLGLKPEAGGAEPPHEQLELFASEVAA